MNRDLLTPVLSLVLSATLFCPGLAAQDPQDAAPPQVQDRNIFKPDPKKAKKLAEQAAKEEAAGDYVAALDDYEQAAHYAPFDVTLVDKAVALRARLLREHVDSAERLAIQGNIDGATTELAQALEIDPGNPALLERLQQVASLNEARQHAAWLEPAKGLAHLTPAKLTHSFNVRGDIKNAYDEVARVFGLKAIFDPDLPARNVRLRLPDVDFYTAVKVLGLESGTFWLAVDSKTFLVAADSSQKRRDLDPQVEQTFALPVSASTTDIGELVKIIRELTGITRVSQSYPNHSITVRGNVQPVRLAQQIVQNLEQPPGEVLLEIALLEVDRSTARNLGVTPPASTSIYYVPQALANSLRTAPDLTSLLTLLAQVFGTGAGIASGGLATLATSVPAVLAFGGGKTTYLLGLPTFTAQFSQGLSLVQSGREILLRAQDGKPATFFVGERYPITLSLLSGSLGSTSFTPSVGGTGVSIPTEQFTVGTNPVAMLTADFRDAGSNDLAVVNQGDNTLTILLNQGVGASPQFAQATTGLGLVSPVSLGTKWTSSTPAPAIATGSLNAATTAANSDNFPDLVITDPVGNTVIVLLGDGDGTFKTPATPIPVGNQPSAIVVGTFDLKNSDSNPGFVVTNLKDNTYSVFNGNGDGTFTQVKGSPFALPTTATGPVAIVSADFNGDGYPDLAIVNQTTKNVTILEGNGNGTFTEFSKSPLTVGNTPVSIATGSLSGSTGSGLAIVNQADNTVSVYLGNGDGTFFAASQSPLATDTTPTGVAIADFTGQSNGGIAVANTGAGTVTVFTDLGSGLFATALEPAAGTNPTAIVAGTFTNSTFPDVAVTNNLSGTAGLVTLITSPVSLISGGTSTQEPYPGSEYVDIGIKVKATPTLHVTKDVTLQLEFEIKALSGESVNGIPIISNRTVTQTVRLKENETSLVTGVLSVDDMKTITGIPGLAPLPGIGYLFGSRNNTFTEDELLFLITPRRVRSPLHESETFYAGMGDTSGRGAVGGGGVRENLPGPARERGPEPAPAQPPAEQPAAPPAGQPTTPPANPPETPPATPPENPPQNPPAPPPAQQPQPNPNQPDVPLQQPPN